ncbi:CHAT domain-containing protein [Streptomyces sp. NPDC020951]|uniref:CHAT domain-containing protein n=1 Tax=Streptomyces sp. NPDC020951 TaxID=3365104 RepID=UPI0037BA096F
MTTEREAERDRLLASARRRLRRVRATGDGSPLRTPEAQADLRALHELRSDGRRDAEAGYRLAWLLLLQNLQEQEPDESVVDAMGDGFADALLAGIDDLPAQFLAGIASIAEPAATALLRQAQSSSDPALLDTVVDQHRRIVAATPADHPGRPQRLANLGVALHSRFERRPAEEDLTAAMGAHDEAVRTTRPDDPDLPTRLSGRAGVLWSRHRLKGDPADLDAAVEGMRAAVDAAPAGSPKQALCLSNLALTLRDRFGRYGDPADLDAAVTVGREAWQATPADDPNRSLRLHNLAGTLLIRYRDVEGVTSLQQTVDRLRTTADGSGASGAPADAYTLCFLAGLDDIPSEVVSDVAATAAPLALARQLRLMNAYDPAEHETVIALWRRIIGITPPGDRRRHISLANLSQTLLVRYQLTGAEEDLAAALGTARRAVRTAREDDPERGLGVVNLAAGLSERYRREGETEDLDLAVDLMREAAARVPHDHTDRAQYLCSLGTILALRFERHEDPADLDDAIAVLRESTRAVPADPKGLGLALNNLGEALELRHALIGDTADLNEAVGVLRVAVEATPEAHADRVQYLASLSSALTTRGQVLGDQQDLKEAVDLLRAALPAAPTGSPVRSRVLHNLALAHYQRLFRTGLRQADLDEAVTAARTALADLSPTHPAHAKSLGLLADALRMRYEQTTNPDDLTEAVAIGRDLLRPRSELSPARRAEQLTTGAGALHTRYLQTASTADLDETIDALRTALRTSAPGHGARLVILNNLALALLARCVHTHSGPDLDAAIDAQRTAVEMAGPRHSARAQLLGALGGFLQARHGHSGSRADLDESIGVLAAAAEAAPAGHPARARVLPNWSNALLMRSMATGDRTDLDAAVAIAREAVAVMPADGVWRSWALGRFGQALAHRHESDGPATDLDEAVTALHEACHGTGGTPVATPVLLHLLGEVLAARHERDGDRADLAEAVRLSAQIASLPSAPPTLRIAAAIRAGQLLTASEDLSRTAGFFEEAVTLLPRIAPRRLRRGEQQYLLSRFQGLAAVAAALALRDPARPPGERALRALRLLETGRGVLMGQALDAWSESAVLRRAHPELAARFEELRDILDRPDDGADALMGGVPAAGAGPGAEAGAEAEAGTGDRHRLDAELAAVLERIRAQDGFGSFGLPPSVGELLAAAQEGAVVVLNVTTVLCDALLVTPAGVTAVPLPGLTLSYATDLAHACQRAAHEATDDDPDVRTKAQETLSTVLGALWDVVVEPVLTALGHDRAPRDGRYPRVWWVPGGPLARLPIHAAGHHDGSDRAVLDRVVSSYAPTVRALRHARRELPDTPAFGPPLVVAMPTTPGHAPLDFAADEAEVCAELLPEAAVLLAPGRPPTRDEVLRRLPGCPVVHFACHGDSLSADPAQHRLLLHDHAETPLTIGELATVRLDHARLAYLSACGTAVSYDGVLVDEAVQLTSAFQLCGFRHVVGTLWPVVDGTAVEFAEAFYAALRPEPDAAADPDRSPYALHAAVRRLRDELPRTPSLWASHIHTGA